MEQLKEALLAYYSGTDPGLTIHTRIAYCLKVAAANDLIKSGDAVPSIRYLADLFKINPITAGNALRDLSESGLISKDRGQPYVLAEGAKEIIIEQAEEIIKGHNARVLKAMMGHFNIDVATVTKWLKE